MKKLLYLILFINLIIITPKAQNIGAGSLGGGLSIGTPTGFAMKYWIDDSKAIAGVLGIGSNSSNITSVTVQADYLIHNFSVITVPKGRLPIHYGLGLWVGGSIGVRGVVGLTYLMQDDPMEFFLDLAPSLQVVSDVGFGIAGAIGGRYYF